MSRKHVTLTLKDKYRVIQCIDKGETLKSVAVKFGIGITTVNDIKKKRQQIIDYINQMPCGMTKRKTMRPSQFPAVEKAVFRWYLEKTAVNEVVTGEMLMNKAQEVQLELDGKTKVFSAGWLDRFKNRHGIVGKKHEAPPSNLDVLGELMEENNFEEILNQEEETDDEDETEVEISNIKEEPRDVDINPLPEKYFVELDEVKCKDQDMLVDSSSKTTSENNYEDFTKYIGTLLKNLPKCKALALQPKIIELITTEIIKNDKDVLNK